MESLFFPFLCVTAVAFLVLLARAFPVYEGPARLRIRFKERFQTIN
jgi:hypothetical protein